jgi:hypothetical protein
MDALPDDAVPTQEPPAIVAPAEPSPPPPAPEPPHRPNAVQLDLGLGVVGLAYERVFARWMAVQVEAHVFGTWFGPIVADFPNLRGLGGQIRPSFFLTGDAPRGVYVAPYVRVERVTAEVNEASGNNVGWSAGAFGGYSLLFAERFNLRVGAGAQYLSYVVRVDGTRVAFKSVFPALDLVLGVVF